MKRCKMTVVWMPNLVIYRLDKSVCVLYNGRRFLALKNKVKDDFYHEISVDYRIN